MGLDMYLEKKIYVGNKYRKEDELIKVQLPEKQEDWPKIGKINEKKITYIIEEAGYWRKANAIHNWFVENVQHGEDNCEEYYVSREDLESLLSDCKEVLKHSKLVKSKIVNGQTWSKAKGKLVDNIQDGKVIEDTTKAEELLPTQSGFFFGSTGYDEYYLADIKDTIKILEEALKDENGDFYYQSSW